jgi:MFS family permease
LELTKDELRHNWLIIGVIFVAWLVGYFDKTAINIAAIPISKEFGLDPCQMGLVMSAFFIGFALMTPFGGFLADKFGARKVLLSIMILWSFFTGITGLAWSLTSLIFMRFIFGAAEGGFPSSNSVAIVELMPQEHRGRAKAFLVSGASLGMAGGVILVTAICNDFGWRAAFLLFGGCGIILAAVFFAVSQSMRSRKDCTARPGMAKVSEIIKMPLVWKLAIMQFGIGIFIWGMSSWMPAYWVNVKGLKLVAAGFATAIPSLVAFIGQLAAGWAADKYLRGREGKFIAAMMAIAIISVYLIYSATSIASEIFYLTVAQVSLGAAAPLISVIILKYIPEEIVGTATGVANLGLQFAGIISPAIMGYTIMVFNGSYFAIFSLVMVVMAFCMLVALTADASARQAALLKQ